MQFEHPQLLWLVLVLAPALVAFLGWAQRRRALILTQFIEGRLLPNLLEGVSVPRQQVRAALLTGASVCLLIALARPQWGFTWEEVRQRGLDILVAIDTSKSMLAEDIAPNRLARAKLAVLDLMQQAKADRLGLVAFAGTAFLMCPLTLDDEAFRQSVNALDVDIIPQGGTALTPAIEAALGAFKQDADNYKVLVLFTDGEDHDEAAVATADRAAKDDLRIFTIGMGSPDGELLWITDRRGVREMIKDQEGNVVKSRLNEELLRDIATKANGFYLRLSGAKTIETLYEQGLAPLPKSEGEGMRVKRFHERYQWPLALAVLLLIVECVLPARARKRGTVPVAKPQTLAAAATIVLLLANVVTASAASSSSALKQYEAGQFDEALKTYRQLSERRPDPRLSFNAGASAYRDGQLAEAAKQFESALGSPDLKLQQRAYYNLGNALFRQGEQIKVPESAAPPQPPPPGGASSPAPPGDEALNARIQAWEQSLKQFDSAMKLDLKDEDAKYNYEFVKRKLEELKKQQQQQQNKQDQSKDQQQDQDQKKDPQQDKQSDQQRDQQQKSQDDQKKQNQDSSQKKDDKKDPQDKQQPQPDQKQKSDEQKKQPQDAQKDKQEKQDQDAQAGDGESKPGQMTPQQARQLLDSQRGEEQLLKPVKPANERPPAKDW